MTEKLVVKLIKKDPIYKEGFKAGRQAEREENKDIMEAGDIAIRSCVLGECCKKAKAEGRQEEIIFIEKALEQLKGYGCGYHKNLQRFMEKRLKTLKKEMVK